MTKKTTPRQQIRPSLPRRVVEDLYEADQLLEEGQPEEAREILDDLDRKHPDREPVLELLANACYDMQDWLGYEWALFRLVRLGVGNPEALMGVAGAHMLNFRPAMAVQSFTRFLRRWPDHKDALEARKTMTKLQEALQGEIGVLELPVDEAFELAHQHEEVRFYLDHSQYHQGKKTAERLLSRYPDFAPTLNNLSQIHALEGDLARGIELARKVLETQPENVHALSNLTRMCLLDGNEAEALEMVKRLKKSKAPASDFWTKKAEALGFIGDEDGIIELYEQAEKNGERGPRANPQLLHLAAATLYGQGKEKQARRLWEEALKVDPNFGPASENLSDLDLPAWERNAPWAFSLANWIPASMVKELFRVLSSPASRKNDQAGINVVKKYLAKYPGLALLTPQMLARGDGDARRFVLALAGISKSPELLSALKDFALGQRGPDDLRMEAACIVSESGLLPGGATTLWLKGKWNEILLYNFELTGEPQSKYESAKVRALAEKALIALREEDGVRGQELLERAIALEPDSPSLLYNLAVALNLQGKGGESQSLLQDVHARFPDYLFGIVSAALFAMESGNLGKAGDLLQSLMGRKLFHFDEFNAFCSAQIGLFLAKKDKKSAGLWFNMLEQMDPEAPGLEMYRRRVGKRI